MTFHPQIPSAAPSPFDRDIEGFRVGLADRKEPDLMVGIAFYADHLAPRALNQRGDGGDILCELSLADIRAAERELGETGAGRDEAIAAGIFLAAIETNWPQNTLGPDDTVTLRFR